MYRGMNQMVEEKFHMWKKWEKLNQHYVEPEKEYSREKKKKKSTSKRKRPWFKKIVLNLKTPYIDLNPFKISSKKSSVYFEEFSGSKGLLCIVIFP